MAGTRGDILAGRFRNHLAGWFDAMAAKVEMRRGIDSAVLVRIERIETGKPVQWGTTDSSREMALSTGIYVLRHLGEGDFIVTFDNDERYVELFSKGHLTYEAGDYRVIAL